ncbi:MAG: FAD-dependent oxidoreductase, partial [Proteobacteria bacterium]|nr:FAD-dependent oxidoreductase [Pseudomonadota bacterium]
MSLIEVKIPDIGDFKDVDVVEVLVKAGDRVEKEQSLLSLESDKATIEIPSPHAGVIREIRVKVGDKVSQGTLVLMLEQAAAGAAPAVVATAVASTPASAPAKPAVAAAPAAAAFAGTADISCDVLVLGAGPGGYSAAFRAADLGLSVVLVERYATLGGVCLNVGCIPSKALLHVAAVMDEAQHLSEHGVVFGKPEVDLDKLRGWKEKVVGKLTGGLAGMAKARKVTVLQGTGAFAGANHLAVQTKDGRKVVAFK